MGRAESDVTPSHANDAMRRHGYFDSPARDIVREPDHRHETAQEEIDLRIRCECIECAPIHQAKIRMVEHDVRAETAHDTVEALRREPLEERVRLSARAHAIDNIRTRSVFFKHAINGIHIVLQIRIHADGHVGIGTHGHEPCEKRILMPLVVCEVDARAQFIILRPRGDALPRPVPAAVVDKHDTAMRTDTAARNQRGKFFRKNMCRIVEHFLLVVAGNDEIEYGRLHDRSSL